jgi:hypothetical protein
MQTYDVSQGQQRLATVTVQDDGQIRWEEGPDALPGHDLSADTKTAIEEAITLMPTARTFTVVGFTIRRRLT